MFEEIKLVIAKSLNLKEDEVALESRLDDNLGIDSLNTIELIMDLEDKFKLTIEESEAQKFVTIKDIVDFIEANKKGVA